MNRRELIQRIMVGGTVMVLTPSIITSCTKAEDPGTTNNNNNNNNTGSTMTIDLTNAAYAALNNSGGSVVVQGKIIANTGNNVFVVLDSACTHQGCSVTYSSTNKNFPCPCHGSVFSTSGSVITGPATTSLKSYQVSKSGNILTISLT